MDKKTSVHLGINKRNLSNYFDGSTTRILPKGMLLRFPDHKIYIADGINTIDKLEPIVDKLLTDVEKHTLALAFVNGTYQPIKTDTLMKIGAALDSILAVAPVVDEISAAPSYAETAASSSQTAVAAAQVAKDAAGSASAASGLPEFTSADIGKVITVSDGVDKCNSSR